MSDEPREEHSKDIVLINSHMASYPSTSAANVDEVSTRNRCGILTNVLC